MNSEKLRVSRPRYYVRCIIERLTEKIVGDLAIIL